MKKFYCLDKDGEILNIVEAEDEQDAVRKAPEGTMKVEEKREIERDRA